ncbi:unnamed protein product [Ostreobium quekettii]|uniref:t-SNARE coiled-coil homology domain-containing protein n=1 Tax=Ostreobium quekettii TaxID=121088 RepID=A0A8S1IYV7_9CHLO|nr:unnamed protein product [Ostreobium quekettii]
MPPSEVPDVGAASPPPTTMDADTQQFFNIVEHIKLDMHSIGEKQQMLQDMHEKSKTITRSEEMKNLREQMQDTINAVSKQAHSVKAQLEQLDKLNSAAMYKDGGSSEASSSSRMRTSITAGLKKRLKDCMGEFTSLRKRVQQEYREVVERRVFTVTGQHATEEQIDRMIETGDGEAVFQKAILDAGRGKAVQVLAEIKERQRAVQDLEHSLLELHQIFLDMAVLVEAQGEMLDNVEKQVEKSVAYVESAVKQLVQAKKSQDKTRRLYCCMVICLLLIILIVVLALVKPGFG